MMKISANFEKFSNTENCKFSVCLISSSSCTLAMGERN